MKLAEIFDEDVSVLLGTEIPTEERENEIARQLARISEQLFLQNRRKKRIWCVVFCVLLALGFLVGYRVFREKKITQYGYIGTQTLIKDVSEITDADTLKWIKDCDGQEMEYYILFSDYAPAEISEGYVGKVLVYVPKGFSEIEFHFNEDSSLFRGGKKMDLQIGAPYTDKNTYQLTLIETPQVNISKITIQDLSGAALRPLITKVPASFYVFGKYYEYYNPDGCDMDLQDVGTVESFLNRMPIKAHFGDFQYVLSKNEMHLQFKTRPDDKGNEEMQCWGLIFMARMGDCEGFSWSYPGEDGSVVTKEVTRATFHSLFPDGYYRTWEEFQRICPK